MTGMKEKLGDKYDAWYKRHRVVENQRQWRIQAAENPMNTVPEFEREMPETYSLADAFYHAVGCYCGSCVGQLGVMIKGLHKQYYKKEPWTRAASLLVPELPGPILELLQAVETEVLSPQGHRP
jgi:hypothetical protein